MPNWKPYREALVTSDGFAVLQNDSAEFVAPCEAVTDVSLASLRRALIAVAENHGMFPQQRQWPERPVITLYFTGVEPELAYEDYIPYSDYVIHLMESQSLVLELTLYLEADLEAGEVIAAATHLTKRHSTGLREFELEGVDRYCLWHLRVDINRRGRTVGQVLLLADELSDLMRALEGHESPQMQALWDLLCVGKFIDS